MKTEIKKGEPEQLTLLGFQLAELVRELDAQEEEKKEAMDEFNTRIKSLKKSIRKLAYELRSPTNV